MSTQSTSITFVRVLLRTAFILLLLYGMAYPQLNAESPSPIFAQIRDQMRAWPIWVWAAAGGAWLVVVWVFTRAVAHSSGNKSSSKSTSAPLESTIDIKDAVLRSRGGNGLASANFAPALSRLRVVGWVNVPDEGGECVVVDGRRVLRKTQLLIAPSRLLGRPINARRVMLKPALLEVESKALTSDQLELKLKVSLNYTVKDPVYVASAQDPIAELQNLLVGVAAEHIRAETLESIIADDGAGRQSLKQRLEKAPSVKGRFTIVEILSALDEGDERIIEIIRQTREAIARRGYVDKLGEIRLAEARVQQQIQRYEDELQEKKAQSEQVRKIEIANVQNETAIKLEMIRAMAQAAASGVVNMEVLKVFSEMVRGRNYQTAPQLAAAAPKSEGLIVSERRVLEELRDQLGIVDIELLPDPANAKQPKTGRITFQQFEVLIECPEGYPQKAPNVKLHSNGASQTVTVPWSDKSDLASATVSTYMQAQGIFASQSPESSMNK
jgi:hypothetical protein